jgi:gamma-glutamylcyclotransferase (GGCT)/AIG2-like uncharacterized protein YtfP
VSGGGPDFFFFYGTLQDRRLSEAARRVLPRMKYVGTATMPGTLFAIRSPNLTYPVLILGGGKRSLVRGTCFAATRFFTARDLQLLDSYEEYYPNAPEKSEYLRLSLPVTLTKGETLDAWIYVYNSSLPIGAERIGSGDFKVYLRTHR